MRKKRYLGAISVVDGYLVMTTLRRAEQVVSFSGGQPVAVFEQALRKIAAE